MGMVIIAFVVVSLVAVVVQFFRASSHLGSKKSASHSKN